MGDRTTQQGYSQVDKVRQQFTGYERDNETGLDFAQARYFSSTQGRFLSPDAVAGSQLNPQTLNLYAYVQNNPLAFTDPTGHLAQKAGGESLLSPDDRSGGQPNIRGVTVGTYDQLTDEQRRLFATYHDNQTAQPIELTPVTFDANGVASGGALVGGGPTLSAAAAWNISAVGANAGVAPSGTTFLDQSQLTAFIGVTSMWEKAGVSGLVASVDEIVSDTGNDGYRIRGTFNAGGGENIRDNWNESFGLKKGGGLYSESRRARRDSDSPNGQFTMTKDFRRFDSDVDYHAPTNIILHGRHENSDIRRTGGLHNHLPAHVKRYGSIYGSGPFPITRK